MPKGIARSEYALPVGRTDMFTPEDLPRIKQALIDGQGFKSRAARLLKCSTSTLTRYMAKYPELQEVYDDINEENVDLVHKTMLDRIVEGAQGSHILMMFYLKAKGGWRETQHIINENHTFDWQTKVVELTDADPDIVEGHFVDDNRSGW